MKKYKSGMYGGKFLPMHKGHLFCLEKASSECDTVYLLLITGGKQEQEAYASMSKEDKERFSIKNRKLAVQRAANMFHNVIVKVVDVTICRDSNGEESWDMETPLVIKACGYFSAVYGSEESYRPYFNRAYPWADYIIVDEARTNVPISATKIRLMNEKERIKWVV